MSEPRDDPKDLNSEVSIEAPASGAHRPAGSEPDDFFQVGSEDASALRVYLRYPLFRALDDFALRDTSREQAGLLLGRKPEGGGWVQVEEALDVGIDEGGSRFTARSWQRARRLARHRHPGLEVVGWFHTHPGTGVDLSAEETEVHQKFFSEPWQVVYVVDPVLRERNFHLWREGSLAPASGFRIYGKEEQVMQVADREPSRPDEHLRERYLERGLEKLQRMVRRPPIRVIDYVLVGLLVLNLLVMLLRPTPPVRVDQKELLAGQRQLADQVGELSSRMKKLEEHLAAIRMLDAELGLATSPSPAPVEPSPAPEPQESPAASPTAAAPAAAPAAGGPKTGAKVRLHKVRQGDTMSLIAEKYYGTADPKVIAALGRYNRLKPPNYDIWPGDTVKVPERSALGGR